MSNDFFSTSHSWNESCDSLIFILFNLVTVLIDKTSRMASRKKNHLTLSEDITENALAGSSIKQKKNILLLKMSNEKLCLTVNIMKQDMENSKSQQSTINWTRSFEIRFFIKTSRKMVGEKWSYQKGTKRDLCFKIGG